MGFDEITAERRAKFKKEKTETRFEKIIAKRKAILQEKARSRKEQKEKYKSLYKQELEKERAKLKAQRESDIEQFKTKRAIEKAQARAKSKVKPFTPRTLFKMPSKQLTPEQKRKLKKAGVEIGKTTVAVGKSGLKLLDTMFSEKKTTKRKPAKRKYKKKPAKRTYKKKTTKRKSTKKTTKRKGKTYYCRKCKTRHSYSSKIGRKHR